MSGLGAAVILTVLVVAMLWPIWRDKYFNPDEE